MDYVYDIVLNFQTTYYDFYEWKSTDNIINIKKLPIYKITNKDYLNLKHHDITIDLNTLPKQNKTFLVTISMPITSIPLVTKNVLFCLGKVFKSIVIS